MNKLPLLRVGAWAKPFPAWFLLVLVVYFIGCYAVALHWHSLGIFSRFNLIFNTDPNTNLSSLASGWGWGRNAPSHSLLEYFATFPRLGGELLIAAFGIEDKVLLREYIAMLYAPFFGALSGAVCFRLCLLSGYTSNQSIQVALVFLFSFSSLMFSIVPESYALSGFFLISLLYYYRLCEERGGGAHWVWWTLGWLVTGITITNAVVFGLAYGLFLWRVCRQSLIKAALLALVAVIAVTVLGLALLQIGVYAVGGQIGSEGGVEWFHRYASLSISGIEERFFGILIAFYNTFAGTNWSANDNGITLIRDEIGFKLLLSATIPLITILVIAIPRVRSTYSTNFSMLLISILVFNVALHSVFGDEFFLYSQHWLAALTMLLAPGFAQVLWARWAFGVAFAAAGMANLYFILTLVPLTLRPLLR